LQKNYNIINAKKEKREERRIASGEEKINIIIRGILTGVCIFIYAYMRVFFLIIFIVSSFYKAKVNENHIFNILY
jgi:hypothetical protein